MLHAHNVLHCLSYASSTQCTALSVYLMLQAHNVLHCLSILCFTITMYCTCLSLLCFSVVAIQIQSPSKEDNCTSICRAISYILCNHNVHYPVLNSQPLVPILSQIHPVHSPSSPFTLRSGITFSYHTGLGPSCALFPSVSPPKPCLPISSLPYATCPTSLILINMITQTKSGREFTPGRSYHIWWRVHVMKILMLRHKASWVSS